MKILRSIYNWWYVNVQLLNTVLIIVLIGQLIFYFDIKLINSTILPIAYLCTVFFLIKTFKENQNRNRMEFGKEIYENYKKEIDFIKKSLYDKDKTLKFKLKMGNFDVEFPYSHIQKIVFDLNDSLKVLQETDSFKLFIKKMNKQDDSLLESDDEELKKLLTYYKTMRRILNILFLLMTDYSFLYQKIYEDKKLMSVEQIQMLVRDLNSCTYTYTCFCKEIENKTGIYNIYYLETVRIKDKNILNQSPLVMKQKKVYQKLYPEGFSMWNIPIKKMTKEYIN